MSQLCVAVVLSIASGANLGGLMLEHVSEKECRQAARAYEAEHPGVIVNVRTQGIECAPGQWVYIDTSGKFPELTCVDYSPPAEQK